MDLRALFSFRTVLAATFALAVVAPTVGCGRSGLDDYLPVDGGLDAKVDAPLPDGGDGGTCSPATCPNGCCDGQGICRTGNEFAACGASGQSCDDCAQANYDYCDPDLRQCAKDQPTCDALTCPTGCCLKFNDKQVCVTGTSGVACGSGGNACTDCNAVGTVCDTGSHSCVAPSCGPQNCKGCCAGNACVPGTDAKNCGAGGLQCSDCASKGQTCDSQTGTCSGPPPTCNAQNCPNGCCQGNACVSPTSDTACGKPGAQCQNCTSQNGTCQSGACVVAPTCTAQNCVGCCSGNICYAGFLNNRCGSAGNGCSDCTAQSTTCNTGVTPRVCNSQQTTCPAAYPSCPGNTTTPVRPVTKGACSANDLADAKQACTGGPTSFACLQYFSTIASIHPSCATCLAPFDYSFVEATGIYNCVAPYVGAPCNHSTGCATQCQDTSCVQCPANSTASCRTSVRQGGQCQTYFQQTQCAVNALFGQGQFCNPQQYQGNYGNWLGGVGAHYCL